MNKIILLIIILNFLISCGKKGDLEYKESFKHIIKQKVII